MTTEEYHVRLAGLERLIAILRHSLDEAVRERLELVAGQVAKEGGSDG